MNMAEAGRLGWEKSKEKRELSYRNRKEIFNKTCLYCEGKISYDKRRNKYCSSSCAAMHNNPLRRKKRFCPFCNTELTPKNKKFCSESCASKYKYKTYIERWLRGEIKGGNWRCVSSTVRRWLFEKYESKCCQCGWNKINSASGKSAVQVDHINGDPCDHSIGNLRLLCPSCHSLTSTFGIKNKGNGRSERYKKRLVPS